MSRSLALKVIAVPFIMVATWSATRSILARQIIDAPLAPSATRTSKTTAIRPVVKSPQNMGGASKLVGSSDLDSWHVTSDGRTIHVDAAVTMMSQKSTSPYFWRLKVLSLATGEMVLDQRYLHQMFRFTEPGELKPTFDETFQLPSGKYQVVLSLLNLPENSDPQVLLKDKETVQSLTSIQVSRPITIP